MDGGRRLAQSVTPARPYAARVTRRRRARIFSSRFGKFGRLVQRWGSPLLALELPRGVGPTIAGALIAGSAIYGVLLGGHVQEVKSELLDIRDQLANAAGFGIIEVGVSGNKHISRDDILRLAGVSDHTSLLFLDVADTRGKLEANPWIAHATVLKFYPDRLRVDVIERQAFALWQKDGKLSVISADGTVLEPYLPGSFAGLPLVVGNGAEIKAYDFLALLARFPSLQDVVRASVLVADRRWKNGIDIRLPEENVPQAMAELVKLDGEKKLLSRDIATIDLRLPDRVTVRLSDDLVQAREQAAKEAKDKKAKRKGSDA